MAGTRAIKGRPCSRRPRGSPAPGIYSSRSITASPGEWAIRTASSRTGVGKSQILEVVSLDAVGLDISELTDPASPFRSKDSKSAYWNAFGTPEENEELNRWRRASPLEFAGPRDPPFLFVVPDDVSLRLREARMMCRRLGIDPGPFVWKVSETHRQINHHFGLPAGRGETVRTMRFVRRITW